jgi:hypothetical protein
MACQRGSKKRKKEKNKCPANPTMCMPRYDTPPKTPETKERKVQSRRKCGGRDRREERGK